ncbi:MAG: hypothetical protein U9R56_01945 [candidate division Zixibacteria bacterium]|nr:hypothetical protein [candidate division Zixibacteria bacterium]
MFWKKKNPEEKAMEKKIKQNVKNVEGALWGYMVSSEGVSVDELVKLCCVTKTDAKEGMTHIRVFDPRMVEEYNLQITEYNDLNNRSDLVKHQCISCIDKGGDLIFKQG